ncbi:MAG: M17 family peptidase N-terminal domain-containing protein [Nocardioidaceae bacterium]
MTTASLRDTSARTVKADAVVIGFTCAGESITLATGAAHARSVVEAWRGDLAATLMQLGASAKPGDVCTLPSNGAVKAPLLVAVGLGTSEDFSAETLRRASGSAARSVAGKATVAVALPCGTDEQVRAVVEGSLLGAYAYDDYLSKKQPPVTEVVVLTEQARSKSAKVAAEEAVCVAAAVNFTRDLINRPPNDLYPESFADEVAQRAKKSRVKVSVTSDEALKAQGYGGILGVGKGSARPPRLVTLSYKPSRPVAHLAFVGKGITFDSGGLSIKPSASMATMKCDMSGAAAVAAATFAIAELGLPVRVSAYALPCREHARRERDAPR